MRIHRVLGIVVALALALAVFPAFALENAYRWGAYANQGTRASIVTGNPTLRDNTSGKWSYMRVFVQRIISGSVYYAEIGWLKGTQPESNGQPRSYWTYRATDGTTSQGWGGYPGVGTSYQYQVSRSGGSSSVTWNFYFNGGLLASRSVGWSTADRSGSGGETPNTSQGMGDSNNNNVAYLSGGSWSGNTGPNIFTTNGIYHVDNGANSTSWRVYGNN